MRLHVASSQFVRNYPSLEAGDGLWDDSDALLPYVRHYFMISVTAPFTYV